MTGAWLVVPRCRPRAFRHPRASRIADLAKSEATALANAIAALAADASESACTTGGAVRDCRRGVPPRSAAVASRLPAEAVAHLHGAEALERDRGAERTQQVQLEEQLRALGGRRDDAELVAATAAAVDELRKVKAQLQSAQDIAGTRSRASADFVVARAATGRAPGSGGGATRGVPAPAPAPDAIVAQAGAGAGSEMDDVARRLRERDRHWREHDANDLRLERPLEEPASAPSPAPGGDDEGAAPELQSSAPPPPPPPPSQSPPAASEPPRRLRPKPGELIRAAKAGDAAEVQSLVARGAPLEERGEVSVTVGDQPDGHGEAPAGACACRARGCYLREPQTQPPTHVLYQRMSTPLILAVSHGHFDAVGLLLRLGADVEARNDVRGRSRGQPQLGDGLAGPQAASAV